MATLIRVDGSREDVGFNPRLDVLQEAVGGYIEGVSIQKVESFVYMYVNEEGGLRKLPLNPIASELALQPIVGNVVLLTEQEYLLQTQG